MKDYAGYLFDADGTLIDTMELIYRCFCHSLPPFGGTNITWENIMASVGTPLRIQVEHFLGKVDDETFEKVSTRHMDYQLAHYQEHLRVFDGIPELLAELKKQNKKLAIVTSRRKDSLFRYLKHVGIYEFFDVFITPEDTTEHKPSPAPVYEALRQLNLAPEDALFIGDATFDIESGHAAGVDTVFVAWSCNSAASCRVDPTYIIREAQDILPV